MSKEGNMPVLHPITGEINRINFENYLGKEYAGRHWDSLTEKEQIRFAINVWGKNADISKNTKESVIPIGENYYQPSYTQTTKNKVEKIIDQFNNQALSSDIRRSPIDRRNIYAREALELEVIKIITGSKKQNL